MKANGIGVARCVDQPHIYFEGSFKTTNAMVSVSDLSGLLMILTNFIVTKTDTKAGLKEIREYKNGVAFGKVTSYYKR